MALFIVETRTTGCQIRRLRHLFCDVIRPKREGEARGRAGQGSYCHDAFCSRYLWLQWSRHVHLYSVCQLCTSLCSYCMRLPDTSFRIYVVCFCLVDRDAPVLSLDFSRTNFNRCESSASTLISILQTTSKLFDESSLAPSKWFKTTSLKSCFGFPVERISREKSQIFTILLYATS